jgi:hypothetical protein
MSPTRALKSRPACADSHPTALDSSDALTALLGGRLHVEAAIGFGARLTAEFPIHERA